MSVDIDGVKKLLINQSIISNPQIHRHTFDSPRYHPRGHLPHSRTLAMSPW